MAEEKISEEHNILLKTFYIVILCWTLFYQTTWFHHFVDNLSWQKKIYILNWKLFISMSRSWLNCKSDQNLEILKSIWFWMWDISVSLDERYYRTYSLWNAQVVQRISSRSEVVFVHDSFGAIRPNTNWLWLVSQQDWHSTACVLSKNCSFKQFHVSQPWFIVNWVLHGKLKCL